MARESITVKLTNDIERLPEGVGIFSKDNAWKSPPGGWLPVQEGVWLEVPGVGIYLHGKTITTTPVARLLACHFEATKTNDAGRADYPALGTTGTWQVNSVYP